MASMASVRLRPWLRSTWRRCTLNPPRNPARSQSELLYCNWQCYSVCVCVLRARTISVVGIWDVYRSEKFGGICHHNYLKILELR